MELFRCGPVVFLALGFMGLLELLEDIGLREVSFMWWWGGVSTTLQTDYDIYKGEPLALASSQRKFG